MNKVTRPANKPPSPSPASANATQTNRATAHEMLSPAAIDALSDIAERTGRLVSNQTEKLKTDDGYQVIDPRTVTATFQEFAQTAKADPARLLDAHFRLWADMGLLWQRTAARILLNTPIAPVISP